eukprot:m.57806 g.57806  ORF g.57806 m.57806 type:complete len:273 (+) comp15622_c0_seq4:129-947(+)
MPSKKSTEELEPLIVTDDKPLWMQMTADAPGYDDIGDDQAVDDPYLNIGSNTDDADTSDTSDAPAAPEISSKQKEAHGTTGAMMDENGNPLPPGWEMSRRPDGKIFYIDHTTKTTSWQPPHTGPKPRVGEYVPLPSGWEMCMVPKKHYLDHNTRTSHATDPRPLPEGWEQRVRATDSVSYFIDHVNKSTQWHHPCDQRKAESIETRVDNQGRTYFVNHDTKETSWDNPLLRQGFFGASSQGLPAGWERRYTPEGKPWYMDHNTGKYQWEPPQ